jgi:DNA-binding transcriptional ArsR family regulator
VSAQLKERPQAVFVALADPTRRELIERLVRGGPMSIVDLAAGLPISRQAVSKHIDLLENAGVLRSQRQGRERRLALERDALHEALTWIAGIEAEWDRRLSALAAYLSEHPE